MQPWRVSLTTGSHLHHHGFPLKSLAAFKDHHGTTRGLGPSSSGQVRNCTFFLSISTNQSVQISRGMPLVNYTSASSSTQMWIWGRSVEEVWNELRWVRRRGGEWASLTRFPAHILAHSHVRSSFRGSSTFEANVSLLWWLLVRRCCLECSCHEGNFQLRWDFGLSAKARCANVGRGRGGAEIAGRERKRRRRRRVTLG